MAVLGTSYETGGDFYGRKARQTGEALRMFVDSLHQRREEKRQREQEEIANAFSSIQSAPELADTLGRDIERKYGAKHPEVPQLLAVIRERYRLQQEVPQAGKRFEDLWGQKEAEYAAQQENVARMPDAVEAPLPFNPFGLPVGMLKLPNPNKAAAERALSEVRPELFPRDAWLSMTPRERLAALPYMKNKGYELPEQEAFDPFKKLTPKAAGALAVDRGYIPEDSMAARVIKGEGELELPEAEKRKQEFQRSEREKREAADLEKLAESDRRQRERINLQASLRAAADARQVSGQKEIIDYRGSKRGDGGDGKDDLAVPWKAVVSDSKAAVEDYDKRRTEAVKGLEGSSRTAAEAAFVKANGKRPPIIGEVAARRIAREVRSRKLAGAEADEAIIKMSGAYMAERASGTGDEEALKRATGKSKAPDPVAAKRAQIAKDAALGAAQQGRAARPPGQKEPKPKQPAAQKPLFSEIKDERWRAFAVKEYADQVATGVSPDMAKQFVDDLLRSKGQIK